MSTDEPDDASWAMGDRDVSDVLDRITDAFFALDTDWRFTYVNERAEQVLERRAGELVGANVWTQFPEVVGTRFEDEYRRAMATQQPVSFEEYYPPLGSWFHVRAFPSETGMSVYVRDVTERVERKQELRQFETLAETVSVAILTIDEESTIRYANPAVTDIFGYTPEELLGTSLTRLIPDGQTDRHLDGIARYLETDDRNTEWEYIELTATHQDGHAVPIVVSFSQFEHRGQRRFTGVVRDVTERVQRERTLERQHHTLARLDELNRLVQRVAEGLVEATDLAELAETVCERVTVVEHYVSAWLGWVEPRSRTVTPCAWSGPDDGPNRDEDLSYADASDHVSAAVRTGDVRVSSPEAAATGLRPEACGEEGVGELIAVPVTFEETVYAVLEIRVKQRGEFPEREREILAEFGSVVGHAINAIERKEALMGDRVQVVELASDDAGEPFGNLADRDSDLTIERSVPTADGAHLHYVTVRDRSTGRPVELVGDDDAFDSVRRVEAHENGALFEVKTPAIPLIETLASYGGNVRSLTVEGGVRVVAEFPHGTDVREVFEAARDEHGDVELVSQRSRERDQTTGQYRTVVASRLTDRQREVLEAAYFAGYFEWSRESTGEQVAASLGLSPATFHQHLRAAQRKLLVELLEEQRHPNRFGTIA